MISSIEANATLPLTRSMRTRKRSPGAASATITVWPSACARPSPPGRIRSIVTFIKFTRRLGAGYRRFLWGRSPILNNSEKAFKFIRCEEKQAQARHANMFAQPFLQKVLAGLRKYFFVHVTFV